MHAKAPELALEVNGLSKRYGGTVALDDVSARFETGKIYGLVGINGSGKSTMIKIIAGIEEPSELGGLAFYGKPHASPLDATASHRLGVRVLHQRPAQFLDLSVTENLLLPHMNCGRSGIFGWGGAHRLVRRMLESANLDIDPRQRFGRFSPAQRTMALIARLLYQQDGEDSGRRIVILDEPTAALPEAEAMWLLDRLKEQKSAGHTIIYVSHRLDELFYIADDLTILRNGKMIGTTPAAATNERELVTLLLGHELEAAPPATGVLAGKSAGTVPRLAVKNLTGRHAQGIDLEAWPGEIVGLTGIIGSGFLETAELIFGARPRQSGDILVDGAPLDIRHPSDAMRAGIGMVPSDRTEMAVFPHWSVAENLGVTEACVAAGGKTHPKAAIATYGIKTPGPSAKLWTLSGGNQQKVVLARWMERKPRVLLLCEPTAGVDPGARDDLHRLIRAAAEGGCTVLLASTDVDELEALAHRTLVINRGKVAADIPGGPGSKARIREKII
jgi:ribose transport system ATP-binding protein